MTVTMAGKRILWLGDSITHQGDYVTFVEYYLNRCCPEADFDIISIGLASETASGLSEKAHPFPRPCVFERLERALHRVKPDIVVAGYGMNDGIYHPQSIERMTAFQDGIGKLIARVKAAGARLILLTPTPFDPLLVTATRPETAGEFSYAAPYDQYDDVLSDYTKWELTLPTSDAMVIDLHTPLNDYVLKRRQIDPEFAIAADGIHPDITGHLLTAQIILHALGREIAAPEDLAGQASIIANDPLYRRVKERRELRSVTWLSCVGYIREQEVKRNSADSAEQTAKEMQGEIDRMRRG